MKQLYQRIASAANAQRNCVKTGNAKWAREHFDTVSRLVREHMPSGSGLDNGTAFDWDRSSDDKLVFHTSFHHMNDLGMYDGWTDHVVTVKPSLLSGIDVFISGRNRNDIKDYLFDLYRDALTAEISDEQYRYACGVEEVTS